MLPLSSSMSAAMMPVFANMAAQAESMETVPIMITTSRIRSSSAVPAARSSNRCFLTKYLMMFSHDHVPVRKKKVCWSDFVFLWCRLLSMQPFGSEETPPTSCCAVSTVATHSTHLTQSASEEKNVGTSTLPTSWRHRLSFANAKKLAAEKHNSY